VIAPEWLDDWQSPQPVHERAAVEGHIGSVFQKLGVVDEADVNRRVSAVLAFLEATGGTRAT
jgi:hypothetical protein